MLTIRRLLLTLALAAGPALAQDAEPEGDESRASVAKAAYADGRLWLLTGDGEVFAVAEEGAESVPIAVPERASDLCLLDGKPLIATTDGGRSPVWTLRRRDGERWTVFATVPAQREALVGLECAGEQVALLTSRRLIAWRGRRPQVLRLSEEIRPAYVTSTLHSQGRSLYAGLNNGEWGGGLRRVDRKSGRVSTVESNISGETCGGPLNTHCDPVNGIAGTPWKPGCVAAAIGLVHFRPRGRLVEICGDRVERLFFKPYDSGWPDTGRLDNGEPFSTVAFFGLARRGDSLWAVGIDGLYELSAPGEPRFVAMPELREAGGFWLSFDLPGLVLVSTDINRRASVSASAPMIVARE